VSSNYLGHEPAKLSADFKQIKMHVDSFVKRAEIQYVEYIDAQHHRHFEPNATTMDADTKKWWIQQGQVAMRWSLVAGLLLLLLLAVFISYLHAQHRIKNGRKPMMYHKWLVPQWQLHLFNQNSQQDMHEFYQNADGAFHPHPPPPYNPNALQPPSYQNPPRFSKVVPSADATEIFAQTDYDPDAAERHLEPSPVTQVPTRPSTAHITH